MDHQDNDDDNKNVVTVLVPQHASVKPTQLELQTFAFTLRCNQSGILWRALVPILVDAPEHVAQRLLQLIFNSSTFSKLLSLVPSKEFNNGEANDHKENKHTVGDDNDEKSPFPGFHHRQLQLVTTTGTKHESPPNMLIYLEPPPVVHPDPIFTSVVLQVEHSMLQLQTLSAWYATLGGGYFLCRRLSQSLELARQQRFVALKIGNIGMARQCSVNECYNLIYAGRFAQALQILTKLESSATDDIVTQRQCQAARLLAHRLKKVGKRLNRYHAREPNHTTIDDYQRIRIVEE